MASGASRRPRSLKSRALQLLAQREQSCVELRRKLIAHAQRERAAAAAAAPASSATAADSDRAATGSAGTRGDLDLDLEAVERQVDATLAWLEANGFVSDARFVESRVHAREARFGNLRIRHELAQHGVAVSGDVERSLVDSELARARAVCERKFAVWPETPPERARAARFLAARGFSADTVRQVLRKGGRRALHAHDEPADVPAD